MFVSYIMSKLSQDISDALNKVEGAGSPGNMKRGRKTSDLTLPKMQIKRDTKMKTK